ncbi:MAG: hypothetical protein EA396_13215 [Anaerolineaceae bacterium]|nr:MAG: hypothetical protein EA396_13215 [Anaerolineaceae bacterium]
MIYRNLLLCALLILTVSASFAQDEIPDDSDQIVYTVVDAFGDTVTITPTDLERIISIGGAVTEILYDLGMGDNIIAVDVSSIYPPQTADLPTVGYLRFLSAEPVLSYEPSLIITTEDAGPVDTLRLIQSVGIPVLIVPAEDTPEGAAEKIRTVAAGVGKSDEAEAIIEAMRRDIERAQALVEMVETRPRVLFVFAGSNIALGVLGRASGGHQMLELVNVENAITIEDGYIPLTAEAIVAAAPDIILTTSLSVERVGGVENFLNLPGISLTPAAQNGRIVYEQMDDLFLLGFTPRLGDAILNLTYLLHEDLPRPAYAVVRLSPALEQFEAQLRRAGQLEALDIDEPLTVLAPNNDALTLADTELSASELSALILQGAIPPQEMTAVPADMIEAVISTANGYVYILNGLPE